MRTETKRIDVPNFEATSDGKRIFTSKQWLERCRQYTKRKYNIDITGTGSRNDTKRLDRKRNGSTRRLHMHRPRSTVPNETGRKQNRTGQNSGERFNPTVERIIPTKMKFISQPRGNLLDKTD